MEHVVADRFDRLHAMVHREMVKVEVVQLVVNTRLADEVVELEEAEEVAEAEEEEDPEVEDRLEEEDRPEAAVEEEEAEVDEAEDEVEAVEAEEEASDKHAASQLCKFCVLRDAYTIINIQLSIVRNRRRLRMQASRTHVKFAIGGNLKFDFIV